MSPELYVRALRFASAAHGEQRMPDGDHPYLVHVTSVAIEVVAALHAEPGRNEDLAVACALLHDVVEDTDVGSDIIEREFGASVAKGVVALSKRASVPKEERMADSLRRIREQPHEVWMVKLADRVTNLLPPAPKHWDAAKKAKYRSEGQQILDALGEASPHLAERLRKRIADYPV